MSFFLLCLAIVLAVCSAVITRNMPRGIHIALAGNDAVGNSNRMAISWNTVNQTTTSTVKYGLVPRKYDITVTGSSGAYYQTFNHHTLTEPLIPGATYYYVVGDEESGFSGERQFRAAPLADKKQFSFLAFADLGVYNGEYSTNYISSIKDNIDLIEEI